MDARTRTKIYGSPYPTQNMEEDNLIDSLLKKYHGNTFLQKIMPIIGLLNMMETNPKYNMPSINLGQNLGLQLGLGPGRNMQDLVSRAYNPEEDLLPGYGGAPKFGQEKTPNLFDFNIIKKF